MKHIKEYKSWKSNYNLSDSHEYKNDMISLDNINIDDLPEEIRNYFKLHLKNKMISL